MAELTRRTFLTQASLGVAAGAVAGGLTALPHLAKNPAEAVDDPSPAVTEPVEGLIAHVRDVPTGEISLMAGTGEVIRHDPSLAARLARLARSSEER